jgi:hypothetical protein
LALVTQLPNHAQLLLSASNQLEALALKHGGLHRRPNSQLVARLV